MAAQAEWLEKDYYAVLGVPETASEKEMAIERLARTRIRVALARASRLRRVASPREPAEGRP